MVERLADRLKVNPTDEQGWVRLMRARMVLDDPTGAAEAKADALAAFQADPAAQRRLIAAADGLALK